MLLKVGQSVDHGFDSPIGLLGDCHRRVEAFLGILVTVTRNWRGQPLPASDLAALEQARRYFEVAGPKHTADEESSLFPRLEKSEDEGVRSMALTMKALETDHRTAESLHASTDALIRAWVRHGSLSAEEAEALSAGLDQLARIYGRHIEIEDTQVFPAAARVLSPSDLEEIGREMAARRNVPYLPSADLR